MSNAAKRIAEFQKRIPGGWDPLKQDPTALGAESMLEVGLLCVLTRHLSETAASKTLVGVRQVFQDWNELRVSQVQEFQNQVKTKNVALQLEVAIAIKAYLHEVFLKHHGFDLEFIREDPLEGAKLLAGLVGLGNDIGHYLLWHASGGELPLSLGLLRVLNRAGLMKRTSSVRKAQEELAKSIPEEGRSLFGVRFGALVEFCDAKKPTCQDCPIHEDCPFGERVFKDWKAQQKRQAAQRAREEEAQRKLDDRERKRAEAEARQQSEKLARQALKKRREEERKAKIEERARVAAKKKADLEATKANKAKAAAKAEKQDAAKRAAQDKREAAAKKAAAKKSSSKKPKAKKATGKKPTGKKKVTKKPTAKKKATKSKAPTKARKKTASKPRAAKKPAKKSKAVKRKTKK